MQRKAILIDSSNAVVGKPLPGAAQDMGNWREFLKSDIGGMWEDDEFADISSCPKWKDVLAEINMFCVEEGEPYYLFIAFSGHGAYDKYRKADVVSLNHDEVITVDELRSAVDAVTKNAVIIIDACREEREYVSPTPVNDFTQSLFVQGYDWNKVLESMGRHTLQATILESSDSSILLDYPYVSDEVLKAVYQVKIKDIWNRALKDSGPVVIQSCSRSQFANEQGVGLFSDAMMRCAGMWWYTHHGDGEILSIDGVFNDACTLLQRKLNGVSHDKQNPEINPQRTMQPFIVNIQPEIEKRLS